MFFCYACRPGRNATNVTNAHELPQAALTATLFLFVSIRVYSCYSWLTFLATRGPFFKLQAACFFATPACRPGRNATNVSNAHEWPQATLTATFFLFVSIRAIRAIRG